MEGERADFYALLVGCQAMEAKIEKIRHFLASHTSIRKKEKGEHGEVFTPPDIINEMLDTLPDKLWADPDRIWLDPACGLGNFAAEIVPRLFSGLAKKIPDTRKRIDHILGKMIYMYDINSTSIKKTLELFSELSGKLNIYQADFLGEENDLPKPDIIFGNPPYNAGGTRMVGTKRLHVGFTGKALKLLGTEGWLLFICPPNYREAGSKMNRIFQEGPSGCFKYIRVMGPDEALRRFSIQSRIDIFLYQVGSREQGCKTEFIDEYGLKGLFALDINHHIPNFGLSIFEKMRHQGNYPVEAFRNSEASTAFCQKSMLSKSGRYPIIHLITAGGRKIYRRLEPHSIQNMPKLFLNGLGLPYVFYDEKGVYGPSQTPVVVVNPSKQLVKFCKSAFFQFIVWALKITGNNNLPYIFSDIPKGFGKNLGLTEAERDLIDSFVPPEFQDKDLVQSSCNTTRKKVED